MTHRGVEQGRDHAAVHDRPPAVGERVLRAPRPTRARSSVLGPFREAVAEGASRCGRRQERRHPRDEAASRPDLRTGDARLRRRDVRARAPPRRRGARRPPSPSSASRRSRRRAAPDPRPRGARPSPGRRAPAARRRRTSGRSASRRFSRTGPGCVSSSACAAAKKQPPGKTCARGRRGRRRKARRAAPLPRPLCAGSITSRTKISLAASIVASWSSSFEPKWA